MALERARKVIAGHQLQQKARKRGLLFTFASPSPLQACSSAASHGATKEVSCPTNLPDQSLSRFVLRLSRYLKIKCTAKGHRTTKATVLGDSSERGNHDENFPGLIWKRKANKQKNKNYNKYTNYFCSEPFVLLVTLFLNTWGVPTMQSMDKICSVSRKTFFQLGDGVNQKGISVLRFLTLFYLKFVNNPP